MTKFLTKPKKYKNVCLVDWIYLLIMQDFGYFLSVQFGQKEVCHKIYKIHILIKIKSLGPNLTSETVSLA